MTTATRVRWFWIAVGILVLVGFLYRVRETLPPFLIAMVIATMLDPLLDLLQRRGWTRRGAATFVFIVFLLIFLCVALIIVPMVLFQAAELAQGAPELSSMARSWLSDQLTVLGPLLKRLHLPHTTTGLFETYDAQIRSALTSLATRMVGLLGQSLGKAVWLVIIPIVTFYLMQDVDRIRLRVLSFFRAQQRERVEGVGRQVGAVFTGYLRGLTIVCAGYAFLNWIVLGLGFRVNYALVIALFSGILYAVPYVGAFATIALGALVALATPGHTPGYVVGVAVSLLVANQVFDQLITPRVVGGLVGLHPVLSIFALAVGGEMFGLVGMILAVPLAASIQVILVELIPALTRPIPEAEPIENRQEELGIEEERTAVGAIETDR
jgi:predicted PurR-regulated permease PerM